MKDEKQDPGLLAKNLLWPILHPIGTIKACWMWFFKPVKPPKFVVWSGLVLASSMVFFGVLGAGAKVSSVSQLLISLGVGIIVWFLTMLFGLAGDLNENFHPVDLFVKSLMTGPFWFLVWAIIFHFL